MCFLIPSISLPPSSFSSSVPPSFPSLPSLQDSLDVVQQVQAILNYSPVEHGIAMVSALATIALPPLSSTFDQVGQELEQTVPHLKPSKASHHSSTRRKTKKKRDKGDKRDKAEKKKAEKAEEKGDKEKGESTHL